MQQSGSIPPPVQIAPVLPKPTPTLKAETYSVVVQNVAAQDLLFALARDAKLQIDIHPTVEGRVTLNAIDQTLPQLLERISRQIDMRYEIQGGNLLVMRDTPFLRTYRVDYVSASRNAKMTSQASTQFSGGAGAGGSGAGTGSTATVDVASINQLWDTIVQNVKDILQETDKVLPVASVPAAPQPAPAPAAASAGASATPAPPAPVAAASAAQTSSGFREAASVIGNRESGVMYVRATTRQHERIREFLDQVLANVRRQVVIEATIAEVQLNNTYQRGIDWSRIRRGASGVTLRGFAAPALPSTAVDTGAFIIDAATASITFTAVMRLLETFGDIKILSSPKLSVLNNQIAVLRVTRDIVYFTITPSTTPVTVSGGGLGGVTVPPSFSTSPNVAAEGFFMTVLPQISDTDTIVLNVRPTIRRRIGFATDPNPALTAGNPNLIPIFETRELDSILRIQSGQIAVLGGLMQDQVTVNDDTIPGVRDIPGLGQVFSQRREQNQKTELVIFLRASVVRDPGIEGDFRAFGGSLPDQDFLTRPNPGRALETQPAAPASR